MKQMRDEIGWAIILMLGLCTSGALGETLVWDGGPDGTGTNWYKSVNWDPDSYPDDYDHLYVFSGSPSGGPSVSDGGSIEVAGDAASASFGLLYIGKDGRGTLTLDNGGQIGAFSVYIASENGSQGQVTVNGSRSKLTNHGLEFVVGGLGSATLVITNSGEVSIVMGPGHRVVIADDEGSSGTVRVDGSGSTLTYDCGFTVGGLGGNGMLNIINGGAVVGTGGDACGIGGSGFLSVDGTGSTCTVPNYFHSCGYWQITNGGSVACGTMSIAGVRRTQGTIVVNGSGSTLTADYALIGRAGAGTLVIQNGATVSNGKGYIGYEEGSEGDVIVDGAIWTNSGTLHVGYDGYGMLTIQNRGQVLSEGIGISSLNTRGSEGHVLVDGSGSIWNSTSGLSIGGSGTMTIQNGGKVVVGGTLTVSSLGMLALNCATVVVDYAGSTWTSTGNLDIYSGTLRIQNGGTVRDTGGDASIIAHGSNARVLGPGTFEIRVTYETDPYYCDNQSVDITFGRNSLSVGGTYSVNQLSPADFAGGTLTSLLESSVFNVSFDGAFSGDFQIAIPYDESEVAALGAEEAALMVFRETGPETYEQLDIIDIDSANNRITARSKFFGEFAVATGIIETIDPYPNLMSDGEVLADPEQLGSNEGRLVSGLVADGVTLVLVRAQVAGAGTVEFSIKDENGSQSDVGYLSSPGGSEQVTNLTVDVDELADGRHMAFAVLTAPPAFFRGPGDENLEERPITIEATYTPSGGGDDVISDREIQLVRPPVIMVHGLWSNASAFSALDTELSNNGFVFLYRLSYGNSGPFSENDWVLPHSITNILDLVRSGGYACTKVDVVGHSMGGLLAKRIPEGFAQQNVRKIITIGSPYLGSPLAELLYENMQIHPYKSAWTETLIDLCMQTTHSISGGAISDLRTDNTTPTQIPGVDCQNIIVGLRDDSFDPQLSGFIGIMMFATSEGTPQGAHDFIFGPGVESDWVVSESSQEGDASDSTQVPVAWHCTESKDPDVLSLVLQALNQPAQVGQSMSLDLVSKEKSIEAGQKREFFEEGSYSSFLSEPNGTVEIVEPNEGQVCTPGQSITISVQGIGDTNQAAVFAFFGSSSFSELVDLPWQDDVNVPEDCVGSDAQIIALGLDPNMDITDEDEVNLVLDANVVLEDIIFGFGDEWTFDFKTYPQQSHEFQLYPVGVFSDGTEHQLSVLSEEKEYQSYNETVASVDPNGLITVHSRGTAVVTVTCSSKTTTLIIKVDTYLGDINLNGEVDFTDFAVLANQWRQPPGYPSADIAPESGDNIVDINDLKALTDHWLDGTAP